ncbi:MAG: amino acid adenylation domain-containing protein [Eubacteriales bacterium]|nr:amino acid adenylation domain-containing protein [Eubacteriales bacterium]
MSNLYNIEKVYPLTPMQESILFQYLINPSANTYHETNICKLRGKLDLQVMIESLKELVKRHEILRSIFAYKGLKKAVHIIQKERALSLDCIDLRNQTEDQQELFINNYIKEKRNTRLDLTKDMLIQFAIIQVRDEEYRIVMANHHIIMDGWCLQIIFHEIFVIYNSLINKIPLKLQPATPYSNYVKWLNEKNKAKTYAYWENYLKNYAQTYTQLPFKRVSTLEQTFKSEEVQVVIDTQLTQQLKIFAKRNNVTLNAITQSIWAILLYNYCEINDIIFGYITSGRSQELKGIESIVGLFINTIPMRVKIDDSMSFKDIVQRVNTQIFQSYQYDDCSLREIQEICNLPKNAINHIIIFDNFDQNIQLLQKQIAHSNQIELFDLSIYEEMEFDLSLKVSILDQLIIKLCFNKCVYSKDDMMRIGKHYENVIRSILTNQDQTLSSINILTDEENRQLLEEFNATNAPYPKNKMIYQLFHEQVEKTPNRIALVCEGVEYTYAELDASVNQLASVLVDDYQLHKQEVVAVYFNRSEGMIISILAVLKSQAICLPIDIKYPIERVLEMLEDSGSNLVISYKPSKIPPGFNGKVVLYKDATLSKKQSTKKDLPYEGNPNDIAYLIYTSGSTGKPKAVAINHQGIVNHAFMKINETELTDQDYCCHNLSFNFVASIWLIFAPFFVGSRVFLYNDNVISGADQLFNKTIHDGVTVLEVVPSVLNAFLNTTHGFGQLGQLRTILVSGEKITPQLVNKFYERYKVPLINAYGQSECSDDTLHYHIPYSRQTIQVPIGKPGQNTKVFVLSNKLQLKPIGVPGELYISGVGVTNGYLNNKELSHEKFIDNPYLYNTVMFKTGDFVRWLADGQIEYLDRKDNLIKIRGLRIEAGEIESQLISIDGMREVSVVNKEISGEPYICAYYAASKTYTNSELRGYLSKNLPDYMIPSHFIELEKLPVNSNGKTDRNALPDVLSIMKIESQYEPPRNEMEEKLVEIWKKVLNVDKIGINNDFFLLGGHSLKLIELEVEQERNHISIDMKTIYEFRTIKNIMNHFGGQEEQGQLIDSAVFTGSDKTEERNIIANIEPFNEFFFKSCFYNALIAGIRGLGKDEMPILLNNNARYSLEESGEKFSLGIDYHEEEELFVVLKNMAVQVDGIRKSKTLIEDIKETIDHNMLVILWIDCYEIRNRDDTYHKLHWKHTVLIYGYQDSIQKLNVIDHTNHDTLTYGKRLVDYSDLINAYESYFTYFSTNEYPSFIKVGNVRNQKQEIDEILYQRQFLNQFTSEKLNNSKELNALECFRKKLGVLLQANSNLEDAFRTILEGFNEIINSRLVTIYQADKLFPSTSKVVILLRDSMEYWTTIRGIIAKSLFSGGLSPGKDKKMMELIDCIYKIEMELIKGNLIEEYR